MPLDPVISVAVSLTPEAKQAIEGLHEKLDQIIEAPHGLQSLRDDVDALAQDLSALEAKPTTIFREVEPGHHTDLRTALILATDSVLRSDLDPEARQRIATAMINARDTLRDTPEAQYPHVILSREKWGEIGRLIQITANRDRQWGLSEESLTQALVLLGILKE